MNCPICGVLNPASQRYCGSRGSLSLAAEHLRSQVVEIVRANFVDQKLATLQVADEVEERLRKRINRGTLAIVVIVVLLGAFGIYKFSDAVNKLEAASSAAQLSRLIHKQCFHFAWSGQLSVGCVKYGECSRRIEPPTSPRRRWRRVAIRAIDRESLGK